MSPSFVPLIPVSVRVASRETQGQSAIPLSDFSVFIFRRILVLHDVDDGFDVRTGQETILVTLGFSAITALFSRVRGRSNLSLCNLSMFSKTSNILDKPIAVYECKCSDIRTEYEFCRQFHENLAGQHSAHNFWRKMTQSENLHAPVQLHVTFGLRHPSDCDKRSPDFSDNVWHLPACVVANWPLLVSGA